MKTPLQVSAALLLGLASPASVGAAVRYVNVNNPNPTPPYTSWTTAATVIQDAIDVSDAGDEIVVTDGVYETGGRTVHGTLKNRVAVTKPLTVRSVNGPDMTVIRGYQVPGVTNGTGAVRCVYLQDGASLIGFTIEAGATLDGFDHADNLVVRSVVSGGGVWCESDSVTVSNCVIKGNSAVFGGGVCQGTLENCTLRDNRAGSSGGGALRSSLTRCTLSNNRASNGGAARRGTLSECRILSNSASRGGGLHEATAIRCELRGNVATEEGGGAWRSSLDTCLVTDNRADSGGGAAGSTIAGCTITRNAASFSGGGVWGACYVGGTPGCEASYIPPWGLHEELVCSHYPSGVSNSIVYYNDAPDAPNITGSGINDPYYGGCPFVQFSCTLPLAPPSAGNITSDPLFIDAAAGNFRLQPYSPCINAGLNASAPAGPDLDGNPRIVGGRVDIGAFEFQAPGPLSFTGWATGFGLSGAAAGAGADADGDGLPNGVEYILGGSPSASGASGSPAVTFSGGNRVFTFPRDDASESPNVTLTVETGADLATWPAVFHVGPDTAASTPGVSIAENGSAPDTVIVTIPHGATTRLFARLKVAIPP